MGDSGVKSRCCLGAPVDFYYALCSHETESQHIEAAVEALWDAIQRPGERAWNPRSRIMVRAEFRDRLDVAVRGGLVPVDHIKALGNGQCHLFEIRWTDTPIAILGEDMRVKAHGIVHMRLIHTEPDNLGTSAVALHAHEKIIDGEHTRALQNAEIKKAENLFDRGYKHQWGISQRTL